VPNPPNQTPSPEIETTPGETPNDEDATPLAVIEPQALGRAAADSYRERAQYPPSSQPLADGEDPILRDREVSPISAAGPGGKEPLLVVFPDKVSFESPEPAVLYAYLSEGGERVPAEEIRGVLMAEELQPLLEVEYRDDGGGADPIPGDYIYTALVPIGPELRPEISESFLMRVFALTQDGLERVAASGFLYSNPSAKLTGRYRDRVSDGSLLIDAEIEVLAAGRFHIEGTLYDADGQRSIAWAQQAAEHAPGTHWMTLSYFGRILAQRGIDGPYLLRFVALSTTSQMPNAKNALVEDAHVTASHRVAGFSDAPFDDPDLLDAADRIEGELAPGLQGEQ
jgi:hypothetical protein